MGKSTTVGIIGYGHVGKAMHSIFPDAVIYDKLIPEHAVTKSSVNQCELAIVCVPTPENERDGSCDLAGVDEVVGWLKTPLILIKSAVPPGTTEGLKSRFNKRIAVSPEYFGESSYWLPEIFSPLGWPFLIVGGDRYDTSLIIEIFTPKLGPDKIFRQTDATTAELTKYMENAWLASQVIFAAEFHNIAQRFGVDYPELRELWALDPRVSKWHTLAFTEDLGFGGKCLPKDLKALIAASQASGYEPEFLRELWRSNVRFRPDLKSI